MTRLSVKAIRHYANTGLVAPSTVSDSGHRLYTENDVWKLVLVRMLRELEFSLPQIRRILHQSPDIPSVIQWQIDVLDMQIKHLSNIRSRLEQIPRDNVGDVSLVYLHTILEAMSMSVEDKQSWLENRWSDAMVPEATSDHWKAAFLGQLKEVLPSQWSPEQTTAWTELQITC